MLPTQQGRRHDDRDLDAGHCRNERRTQGDLGLAKADVTADKPIHRLARGKVAQDIGNRVQLIIGLRIGEAGSELLIQSLRRGNDVAFAQLAFRRNLDQRIGDILDALLDAGLTRLPRDATQTIELGFCVLRAVARQDLDILDRYEELVIAMVDDLQAVMSAAADIQRLQPLITTNPVVAMDHDVAHSETRYFGDELVDVAALARRPDQAVSQDILLADQRELARLVAALQRENNDPQLARRQFLQLRPGGRALGKADLALG